MRPWRSTLSVLPGVSAIPALLSVLCIAALCSALRVHQRLSLPHQPSFVPAVARMFAGIKRSQSTHTLRLPILMYHYVENVENKKDILRMHMDTPPSVFEKQLRQLQTKGYATYFVKDIPAILSGALVPSAHSVVLTFDDGYEDFFTDAFPLLQKYHAKATLYVIWGFVGTPGYLTETELRTILQSDLVEVGYHTVDHPHLSTLSPAAKRAEIIDGKHAFEQRFGITLSTFAYPYGDEDAESRQLVQEAGFSAAVSTKRGTAHIQSSRWMLKREPAGAFRNVIH